MSDQKPGQPGQKPGTPAAKAKSNGTTPTVTARRPISKAEYARTTKASPDTTSVIPAVRDDQPAPADAAKEAPATDARVAGAPTKNAPDTKAPAKKADPKSADHDQPTQTMKAVPATDAPEAKPETKSAGAAKAKSPEPPADKKVSPKAAGAAAAGVAAGTAAGSTTDAVTTTPAPATPAPSTPQPESKAVPVRPVGPELKRPSESKPTQTKVAPAAKAPEQKTAAAPATESTRSARLKLSHVEPWSVTKMAFVVSVALMIVSVVAVTVFWLVLQMTGVWGALNDSVSNVLADDAAAFDVTEFLGFGRVVGLTLLVSSLNVIFMTALATIAAHLYNLAAGILGGIELTFGERN